MIRVVVVDDQAIVRDGLVVVLGLIEGIEVVGEASDGAAAIRVVEETAPDVVLMDLRMPVLDGVDATARIADEFPATAVLVLTTFADDSSIVGALRAGALGYLTKDAGRTQLEAAIRSVAAGQTALDSSVGRRLIDGVDRFTLPHKAGRPLGPITPERVRRNHPELTAREAEVLSLVVAGAGNAEIAADLFISTATVKSHINGIFAKLHTGTRGETIARVLTGLAEAER